MANEKTEFNQEAKFLVCGKVKRKWVANSGKYATINIEVPGRAQYDDQVNVRSFDLAINQKINGLIVGSVIKVVGTIGTEAVKDKAGEPVLIDKYKHYDDVLTIKALTVDESSVQSARDAGTLAGKVDAANDNDDVPAGW